MLLMVNNRWEGQGEITNATNKSIIDFTIKNIYSEQTTGREGSLTRETPVLYQKDTGVIGLSTDRDSSSSLPNHLGHDISW